MATPFAAADDLVGFWRPLTPAETTRAENLLRVASIKIRQKLSTIDARIASGELDGELATFVACEMVQFRMERPTDGVKQETQVVGPYTRSVTFDTAAELRAMIITPEQVALLAPASAGAASAGVGTIRLRSGFEHCAPQWC